MIKRSKNISKGSILNKVTLPDLFPQRLFWMDILTRFCYSKEYWKIPKTIALNEENIRRYAKILEILKPYSELRWDTENQKELYDKLLESKLISPYKGKDEQKISDYLALIRIIKVELEYLGLSWISENGIIITKAGDALRKANLQDQIKVINQQILKFRFRDLDVNPSIFVAQLLHKVDYKISKDEWIIFLNMVENMKQLSECLTWIKSWRKLRDTNRSKLLDVFRNVPRVKSSEPSLFDEVSVHDEPRYVTIEREYTYQKSFILFPFRQYFESKGK